MLEEYIIELNKRQGVVFPKLDKEVVTFTSLLEFQIGDQESHGMERNSDAYDLLISYTRNFCRFCF